MEDGEASLVRSYSLVATFGAFALAGFFALETQQDYARLRENVPYESMEQRLPRALTVQTHPLQLGRLAKLEEAIADRRNTYREIHLQRLHEEAVTLFVNSPGFGVARLLYPTESGLAHRLRDGRALPQPGDRPPVLFSLSQMEPLLPRNVDAKLEMHEESVIDFVHPAGFGFVKSRTQVAGFQSHQFSEIPRTAEHWAIQRLELLGLLLHEEPVGYVSESLPRMDELREAPTRPLDSLEVEGLAALRTGQSLFVRASNDWLRMVGELRSTKQCVACHGGSRGDLLGAFSYTLRRASLPAGEY